ncbi:copper transporter [Georgenia sp. MJ206]|uniref:copper transporter n=1 Tax=Georgenia wangjunii TaxID=3117730 RepID=UPI002F261EFA
MIDFRYHLVSLISVFLALALGILLGAGPLNDTIGDQLTGQVEDLRTDRDRLRTELELSRADAENRDVFIAAVAPDVVGSRLEGRAVAVVSLPGAEEDDVADVRARIEQSGATVSAEVAVTPAWTDPETDTFRSSFAGQLLGYLAPAPEGDASTDAILGAALGQALTATDATGGLTVEAETLLDLLASADDPLVSVVEGPAGPANATVLVAPRTEPLPEAQDESGDAGEEEDTAAAQTVTSAHVSLAQALSGTGEGSVVIGAAVTDLDLVTAVRADGDVAAVVTTVDSVADVTGRVSVPLALAADISGDNGHYGFGVGAEQPVPESVYLAPPAPPEPEPAPIDAPAPTGEPTEAAATEAPTETGQDG